MKSRLRRAVATIVALFAVLTPILAGSQTPDNSIIEEAQQAYDTGSYVLAMELCNQVPDSAQAQTLIGRM